MQQPTLVVMAAGIGSRYGGLKQIDPVGPGGEIIIDYALYDAIRAGFGRVVFVIKRELESVFRERIGRNVEGRIETHYVFQEVTDLPEGFSVPEGRTKPWGTGHAVLAARNVVDGPFAVINGDDFYGREGFQALGDFLRNLDATASPAPYAMVGFPIENTVTDHGTVARGVCATDAEGFLVDIVERTAIKPFADGIKYEAEGGWQPIPHGTPVSMNLWGFGPGFMTELEARFPAFLAGIGANPLKAEYFLPYVVDALLKEGKASVRVLPTRDRWFGVTYQEDKPLVTAAIQNLVARGVYPARLWEA